MRPLPILLLALLGCSGDGDDTGSGGSADDARTAVTDGGTWRVSYTPDPDPIALSEPFSISLTFELADGSGDPTGIDALSVDAGMPEHGHGMNVYPVTTYVADGSWEASPLEFHMEGLWELSVIAISGSWAEQAKFEVECCD